jgi:hypothetical protein
MLPSIRDHALAVWFDNLTCLKPDVGMIGPLHKTRMSDAELGKAPMHFGKLGRSPRNPGSRRGADAKVRRSPALAAAKLDLDYG